MRRFSLVTAGTVVVAGLLCLLGWMFDIAVLKSVVPNLATMKANTAAGFVLLGMGSILLQRTSRRAGVLTRFCGYAAALLGALTLAEYISGVDFGIDEILFSDSSAPLEATFPSRMSPITALNFAAIGIALLLLEGKRSAALRGADALLVLAMLLSSIAIVGYLYNVSSLYRISMYSSMALHTAALFVALSAALLAAPPIRGVSGLIVGDDLGAALARKLLPMAVIVPPLVGFIRLVGQQKGFYGTEFGLALFAMSNVVIFTVLACSAAFSLRRTDLHQRESEQALRASEQRYRFMCEAMPQILWTSKPDGRPDFFNQRWFAYTGLTVEESKDWSGWERAVHPDDLQRVSERWHTAYSSGGEYAAEYRFRRAADGAYRWQLGRASPLRNADGAIIHWVGTCTDIEDQKLAERNLVQAHATLEQRVLERTEELAVAKESADSANRSKSEFLANMSHEIRTPLNAVIGLGYLLEQTTLSDDQRQFLTKIQFAGRALLGVINNVLDLSKIEAGAMAVENEPFDLPQLVQDLAQMLAPSAKSKGIELIVRMAAEVPRMVQGDATRLRQILINLVNNSIKFTEVGKVELNLCCTQQNAERICLRCEVADTGIGIEPATLERLFTPFTQADASTTRRFGGTGLGLSISRRLVELLGGAIGVDSVVAVGSTFWIEIPLDISLDRAALVGNHHAQSLQIFIADSKGDVPEGLGALARALGWIPRITETGEQLLDAVSRLPPESWPDVFVLDLNPHDTQALHVITLLATQCQHGELPPVVMVTNSEQTYLEPPQGIRPTDVVLLRPVSSSALFNAINSAVWKVTDENDRVMQSTHFDERRAQWLSAVRVLVVDDSEINREVARRILEKQGAIVTTCSDGASALEQVRAHHPHLDIVLMDVQMPILDGNQTTRRIRCELGLATLPIVALTAGALVIERQRSIEAGMNDFITKPFEPQALIRAVRHLVERARGEPIPMVILQAEPAALRLEKPYIPSIDSCIIQQLFGEDLALFQSLLKRMLLDFADFSLPVLLLPDAEEHRAALKARAHKLKGSSGMIGAVGIMRLAGAVERALQEARPGEVIEGMLRKLAAALTTLREEAADVFVRRPDADFCVATEAAFDELYRLLGEQNLAAVDKFSRLSVALKERLGALRFECLRETVENLDFPRGAELLREALRAQPVKSSQAIY